VEKALTDAVAASVEVPLHGIEGALDQAWRSASAAADTLVSRTVTTNVIALACETDRETLEETLERVTNRHPCRAFVVFLGPPREQGELRAELTTRTQRAGGGAAIVHERITLHCPADEVYKLPGLIRPLVDDDVPGHLYWHGSPPADLRDLASLSELAHQVIFDSSTFDDPIVDLGRQQSLESQYNCRVRDITWYRLRPWRRALALALEHAPWDPAESTRVVLHHPDDGRGLAAALMLAEWLRERLRASTTLLTVDDPGTHREPVEVALATGDSFVRVHRMENRRRLEVTVTLADQCLLPTYAPVSLGQPGDLLAAAMDDAR